MPAWSGSRAVDMAADRVADMAADTVADMAADMVAGKAAVGRAAGMVAGSCSQVEDKQQPAVVLRLCMVVVVLEVGAWVVPQWVAEAGAWVALPQAAVLAALLEVHCKHEPGKDKREADP